MERYSIDISMYDPSFLERTLTSRLLNTGKKNFSDYLNFFENSVSEHKNLLDSFQVTYSEFFRYPLSFYYIGQIILPSIIQKKKVQKEKEIRIWSCACAEGQEPYSIAILWNEIAQNLNHAMGCRIFATDISTEALNNAKKGVYNIKNIRNITFERVENNFTRHSDTFILKPKIRDFVDFSSFDLLTEECSCPPASIYGNFDIVFCCNLLFYFNSEYRKRIVDKATHCLTKGGFLVTGETERDIVGGYNFKEVYPGSAIFKKL